MILKIRHVKKSRKVHFCDWCNKEIWKGKPYTYLYGSAHRVEKPYAVRYCPACQAEHEQMKVAKETT